MSNKFTIRFNELMSEHGVTQAELCRLLSLSKNQVHYWLKGKAEPSIDSLIFLAQFFGVTIDYLVGYENDDGTINL